jgi:hypothetical protein
MKSSTSRTCLKLSSAHSVALRVRCCSGSVTSRYPRAYARGTWELHPEIQWYFARGDLLLKLHIALDDVCVAPDRGGEKTDGPPCVPPVSLLEPGETLAPGPTRGGVALANAVRHGLRGGQHAHPRPRIALEAPCRACQVRRKPRPVAYALFPRRLAFPREHLLTRRGAPNNVGLRGVGTGGPALALHAPLVSKPAQENLQPSAAGFHPRVNTRGPQPDF